MPSYKKQNTTKDKTVSIGRRYEQLAARFFIDNGFEILERNWRAGRKEVDLVVKRGQLVVFVEVKAAKSEKFGHPAERVDRKKQENLILVANRYLQEKSISGVDLRFDVVTFVNGELEHYPGAFDVTE
jgi:putative endonuclease